MGFQSCEATQYLFDPAVISTVKRLWERFGRGQKYVLTYVKDNYGYWYHDKKDLKELTEYIIEQQKKNPNFTE